MKSMTVKYNEAVERNLAAFHRRISACSLPGADPDSPACWYGTITLEQMRTKLGIRKGDTSYDLEFAPTHTHLVARWATLQADTRAAAKVSGSKSEAATVATAIPAADKKPFKKGTKQHKH